MLSYNEAIQVVGKTVKPLPPRLLPLAEAAGLVLAEETRSCVDLPPADNSAMDGYAYGFAGQRAGDRLPVTDFIPAGVLRTETVPPGRCVKIMTGAPLPPGCDTVVPIEETEESDGQVRLLKAGRQGEHVRYCGEEIRKDEILLSAGTLLSPGEIGLLAAAGVAQVRVYPRPRVAVLSTGDELVELGAERRPGQIVNSNSYLLAARLRELGCEVVPLGIGGDEPESLRALLREGFKADMLITSGGVSMGDRDLVQEVLHSLGFVKGFWKVAIKPGKPVLFGTVAGKPVFGLPGNPAASAATLEIFAAPAARLLAGAANPLPPRLPARLGAGIPAGGKRETFLWGRLRWADGGYVFDPHLRQGSGQNRSLQGAHALLAVPVGAPALTAGETAEVLLLRLPPGGALCDSPGLSG